MKRFLSLVLIAVLMFSNSGCASIVCHKSQDVRFRSNPPGAQIIVDGTPKGEAPAIISLKRKERHEIQFTKDGYVDETRATKRGFNWWFTGNLIFGGIIGIIVDFATGAVYSVEPEEMTVDLTPKA